MQNIAEFRILGRIGRIDIKDRVTFIEVASNYPRKDANGEWHDDPHWNRITLFGKLHERAGRHSKGDLIHITGRVRQSRFEKDGHTHYGVDLIAERVGTVIRFGSGEEVADHGQDLDDDIPY